MAIVEPGKKMPKGEFFHFVIRRSSVRIRQPAPFAKSDLTIPLRFWQISDTQYAHALRDEPHCRGIVMVANKSAHRSPRDPIPQLLSARHAHTFQIVFKASYEVPLPEFSSNSSV